MCFIANQEVAVYSGMDTESLKQPISCIACGPTRPRAEKRVIGNGLSRGSRCTIIEIYIMPTDTVYRLERHERLQMRKSVSTTQAMVPV
jgi:hypothetical protein